jgi:putative ABC transport system permease protein
MKLSEIIKSAFHAIMAKKTRSFLTMLGVIIGVFAVAALLSIGQASMRQMNSNFSSLGAEVIEGSSYSDDYTLDMDDLETLAEIDTVDSIAPTVSSRGTAENGNNDISVTLVGTTWDYARVMDWDLVEGRSILPSDDETLNKVAVIGQTVAMTLFGRVDVFGEQITISGETVTVIGVLSQQEESNRNNPNEMVVVPLLTGQTYFSMDDFSEFTLRAASADDVDETIDYVSAYLLTWTGDSDDFEVSSSEDIQEMIEESNNIMMAMLGGIGGISLLVSGIGIMNTMLGSVRERIKEIGIRKAIGAKRRDIMTQFLFEAVILSGLGGMLGIVLTVVLAAPVGSLMSTTVSVSPEIALLSVSFSLIVGVVFGLYPAGKASKLNPVQALHYE